MIELSWDNFKQLFNDGAVKFRALELDNDYRLYAKDEWLEFTCAVSVENEEIKAILNSPNSRIKLILSNRGNNA